MKSSQEKAKYSKPLILDHRPVHFETAHSWNPGLGKQNDSGNDGINYKGNKNSTPAGAGTPGIGVGIGNGN